MKTSSNLRPISATNLTAKIITEVTPARKESPKNSAHRCLFNEFDVATKPQDLTLQDPTVQNHTTEISFCSLPKNYFDIALHLGARPLVSMEPWNPRK